MDRHLGDRSVDLDRHAVARLDAADQLDRLRVQHAGLQRAEGDAQAVAGDQVGDHHVLGAQAGRLHDAAGVGEGGLAQHRQGVGDAVVVAGGGAGVEGDGAHERTSLGALSLSSAAWRANSGRFSTTSPW